MPNYKMLSDAELSDLLRTADRYAFEEIYNRYWVLLFNHARRLMKDEEQAKDLVQDTFSSLWNKTDFNLQTSLAAYLYQSIRYQVFNLIRREKLKVNYLSSIQQYLEQGTAHADAPLLEKELAAQIEREIEALPPKMRRIFELSRNKQLSYKEIAKTAQVAEGTVRKQIYYSLKILRSKLSIFLSQIPFV